MSSVLSQPINLGFSSKTTIGAALGASLAVFVSGLSWQKIVGLSLLGGFAGWAMEQASKPGGFDLFKPSFEPSFGKQAVNNALSNLSGPVGPAQVAQGGLTTPLGGGFLSNLFQPRPDDSGAVAEMDRETSADLSTFQQAAQPTGSPPPMTTTNGIMPPETAYNLIRAGKYSAQVRNAKMSRWYLWRDAFVSGQFSNSNIVTVPLSGLQGAAKHAKNLDLICDQVGRKAKIYSWLRPNSNTYHSVSRGWATDFDEPPDFLRAKVIPAARRVPGITGIGPSDHVAYVFGPNQGQVRWNTPGPIRSDHTGLHLDSGPRNPRKGYQFVFRDNGDSTNGQNYHEEPMLGVYSPPAPTLAPTPTPAPTPQATKNVQGAVVTNSGFSWLPTVVNSAYQLAYGGQPAAQERGII